MYTHTQWSRKKGGERHNFKNITRQSAPVWILIWCRLLLNARKQYCTYGQITGEASILNSCRNTDFIFMKSIVHSLTMEKHACTRSVNKKILLLQIRHVCQTDKCHSHISQKLLDLFVVGSNVTSNKEPKWTHISIVKLMITMMLWCFKVSRKQQYWYVYIHKYRYIS